MFNNSDSKEEEVGEVVPAAQRSGWASFLKSIAAATGDLSSLTAPPFILSPISLTEFPAYWCERPQLFSAIAEGATEEERAKRVLRWFISTLKGQYTSRNESLGSEKKPLNPVLGEVFYGIWPSYPPSSISHAQRESAHRGMTTLLVEQVSHHPPITAYRIANESKGVELVGHNAQKTSFSSGSIVVKQVGHAILTVQLPSAKGDTEPRKEEYLITLPRLRIDGLWYGSPYVELSETSWIASSTGWMSTIEYKGKGYFSGKLHSFKATLTPPGVPPPVLGMPVPAASNSSGTSSPYSWGRSKPVPKADAPGEIIEGVWHIDSRMSSGAVFHDVTSPKEEVTVAPLAEQDEWESRKLWEKVAKGIREGDFEIASREKSRIENDQRQRRKTERETGISWELKHFKRVDNDVVYERLAQMFRANPTTEDSYEYLNNPPEFLQKAMKSTGA